MSANIIDKFPIECRVKIAANALHMFPRYRALCGTVVGYSRERLPLVRFDLRKTARPFHEELLIRADGADR